MKNFITKALITLLTIPLLIFILLLNAIGISGTTYIVLSYDPKVVADEHEGAFISIYDFQERKVFTQHLDSSGNFTWEGSGTVTPISSAINQISCDEKGGVILVWEDTINGIQGLFAQRINKSGNTLWEDRGVLVHKRIGSKNPGWLANLAIVPDKEGGAIVIWQRLEDTNSIYAQKIDSYGRISWDIRGILVSQNTYYYHKPNCVTDGMGGAIIVWNEGQTSVTKTNAQRLDKEGNLLWGSSGVQIGSSYSIFKTVSDGNGGATVVFHNYEQISFLRLDQSGKIIWGEGNSTGFNPPGAIYDFQIMSDGHGGMFIVWSEEYSGLNFLRDDCDLYAQRVDSTGNSLWRNNRIVVCNTNGNQRAPIVVPDGSGGFIVSWEDFRSNSSYIFAQRITASGKVMWAKNGINLGRMYRPIRDFKMVSNGTGGAIIIREEGESLEPRVFSQVIDKSGTFSQPEIALYPQGLSRAKRDYEALMGSTFIYQPKQDPALKWLLPVGIPAGIIITVLAIFLLLRKHRRNRKIDGNR